MTKDAILKELERIKTESDFHYGYAKLKALLLEDIRIETAKQSGNKASDIAIIKRITVCGKQNKLFANYNEYGEYKAFLEGHYILCSKDSFGYDGNGSEGFKVINMFKSGYEYDTQVEIDLVDLKTATKTQGRKEVKPYVITVNDDLIIGVNPFFLLDCLQFCNTNIIYVTDRKSPLYVKRNDGERFGLVLPIMLN